MRAVAPTSHRDTAAKFGGDRLDIAERPVAAAVIELVQCTGLHRKHVIGRRCRCAFQVQHLPTRLCCAVTLGAGR